MEDRFGISFKEERANRAYMAGLVHGKHPLANAASEGLETELREVDCKPIGSVPRVFVWERKKWTWVTQEGGRAVRTYIKKAYLTRGHIHNQSDFCVVCCRSVYVGHAHNGTFCLLRCCKKFGQRNPSTSNTRILILDSAPDSYFTEITRTSPGQSLSIMSPHRAIPDSVQHYLKLMEFAWDLKIITKFGRQAFNSLTS